MNYEVSRFTHYTEFQSLWKGMSTYALRQYMIPTVNDKGQEVLHRGDFLTEYRDLKTEGEKNFERIKSYYNASKGHLDMFQEKIETISLENNKNKFLYKTLGHTTIFQTLDKNAFSSLSVKHTITPDSILQYDTPATFSLQKGKNFDEIQGNFTQEEYDAITSIKINDQEPILKENFSQAQDVQIIIEDTDQGKSITIKSLKQNTPLMCTWATQTDPIEWTGHDIVTLKDAMNINGTLYPEDTDSPGTFQVGNQVVTVEKSFQGMIRLTPTMNENDSDVKIINVLKGVESLLSYIQDARNTPGLKTHKDYDYLDESLKFLAENLKSYLGSYPFVLGDQGPVSSVQYGLNAANLTLNQDTFFTWLKKVTLGVPTAEEDIAKYLNKMMDHSLIKTLSQVEKHQASLEKFYEEHRTIYNKKTMDFKKTLNAFETIDFDLNVRVDVQDFIKNIISS